MVATLNINSLVSTQLVGWASGPAIANSSGTLQFLTASTARWNINTSGHLLAALDNTYDIGANLATRPRSIYAGGSIYGAVGVVGAALNVGTASTLYATLYSAVNGNLRLSNNISSDFGLLQFGGTTSSFPALKRNTTTLETKLADDSAYTRHAALRFQTMTALRTATDGGSTASFTANMVGSTNGPTTAAQNGWVEMVDSAGNTFWVPIWK